MVIDHLAVFTGLGAEPFWRALGRMAFPLFGFVLAVNLADRGGAPALARAMPKLLLAGGLAQPFAMWLSGEWLLNVMFTLALGAWLAFTPWMARGPIERFAAFALACTLGLFTEFSLPGVIFVWASAQWAMRRDAESAWLWLVALAALAFVNSSFYALMTLLPVYAAMRWGDRLRLRRMPRGWLYAFYPLHLAAIALWVASRQ